MRVVHLLRKYNPAEWGGTETALQRLFVGLRQHDVDSVVYCPRIPPGSGEDPLARAGCAVRRFDSCVPVWGLSPRRKEEMIAVGGNLLSFNLPVRLWREASVSVIHTHTLGRLGGAALRVAKCRRLPFVVTIHGGVFDLPAVLKSAYRAARRGWEWGRLFGFLFQARRLFVDADAILACNAIEADALRARHPAKRVLVQPHGVPAERYRTDCRAAARAAFPALSDRRLLLCVGRIDPVKNQGWLIEQAPEIFRRHPRVLLVLAGACTQADYLATLQQSCRAGGLQDRVLFTGGLPPEDPRLIGLLQTADAVVLPSLSETFGLVILEAWAAGRPVIAQRTSGASALIQPGQNGWLFDLARPEDFHAAVDQALDQPALATRYGAAGAERVRRDFDTGMLAGKAKALYAELIEEKHALRHSARR
ncbi:MAG: glycosyltransferase family 4 protein [Verrucomicrobia bacterium]|nr:glycosyltransferase family 4 protein [Verrucomicrobiota bacterium]